MKSIKTVFIADDDKNLVESLSTRCKSLGVNVRSAFDGIDVAVAVVAEPPDLLILDVNMPGADGLNVCAKIMEYQSLEPIPIILLTGRTDKTLIETADKLGAYYVRKDSQTWESLRPLIFELLYMEEDHEENVGNRSLSRKIRRSA